MLIRPPLNCPCDTSYGDVASVTDWYEPKRVIGYVNGQAAISVNVQKATGASEVRAGEAVLAALGDKKGILRAGYFLMPMDETLAAAAIDFGGRAFCVVKAKFSARTVGGFQTELVEDFFQGFAQAARANVHLRVLYGRSSHHQVEAIFKAFARALRFAVSRDKRLRNVLPSTKELL